VLVVTHLPQVAAYADRHLMVAKDTSGAVTTSGVLAVQDTERARELARMLAGLPDSDLGIAHAEGAARGCQPRQAGIMVEPA
jgi:DNA repair protein RecN (Recombination protein N)